MISESDGAAAAGVGFSSSFVEGEAWFSVERGVVGDSCAEDSSVGFSASDVDVANVLGVDELCDSGGHMNEVATGTSAPVFVDVTAPLLDPAAALELPFAVSPSKSAPLNSPAIFGLLNVIPTDVQSF
jgi:hypothetical protein